VKPTGAVPTLLYGYGGFGESITPEFPFWRVPWLEAGGVYALANLRGGGEYGEPWHRAGMAERKQTTIDDLLAAGHYLIEAGWTSSKHLGFVGGSNGGMVVSAAIVQDPGLAGAAILTAPLTDMVRYARFGHATAWIPEYGSPDDPAQFAALYAYSPYHHVVAGTAYPATFIQISDRDDRVDPLHGRKLAAALQAATTGGPVLLQVLKDVGHSGADAIDAQAEKAAAAHAFALRHLR
jgi:prolyl oligopeptidase